LKHIDHVLFDQTKGQLAFKAARDFAGIGREAVRSDFGVEFF